MSGTLFVVGTPIGNLGDFTLRGIETLKSCDFIAAEDTRVALKLLNRFGIKKPTISYFECNRFKRGPVIIERLLKGESCALVTDAGTPAISDPGEDLVRKCRENGIKVEAVPGPCALVAALSVSGAPSRRFAFEGFLPTEKRSRRKLIAALADEKRTIVFYEAPHRLAATLADLAEALGDRETFIAKELTKIHERVIKTTLASAAEEYAGKEIKGEIVLIVAGAEEKKEAASVELAAERAGELIKSGESKTEAARIAAKESGLKKGDIYRYLVKEEEKDG